MKKSGFLPGMAVIAIGVLLLLKNLDILKFNFGIDKLWALYFLIIPGLIFHIAYFYQGTKRPGLLVPGGVLLIVGLVNQLSFMFDIWHILWPGFIFAPAFGLFELYWFGKKEKGLLVPVAILTTLSLIFFASSIKDALKLDFMKYILPLAIIFIGLAIVLTGKSGYNKK